MPHSIKDIIFGLLLIYMAHSIKGIIFGLLPTYMPCSIKDITFGLLENTSLIRLSLAGTKLSAEGIKLVTQVRQLLLVIVACAAKLVTLVRRLLLMIAAWCSYAGDPGQAGCCL